ncbi:CHAP domain-containing protein [Ligilactobacillus faecis]|uniref:CHAP domain-containing protein n=1 Tax=Ligilactobacillus faecis TaxID=762833 RepID=A0ABV4DPV9_9LACO
MFLKKVVTSTVALGLLTVSVFNNTGLVKADAVEDTQKEIANNKSETDKLLKDIAAANADNIKLQQQISDNTTKIDNLKTDIDNSNKKIKELNGQIESAKVEVNDRTDALKSQLVALQKQAGNTVSGNVYLDFVINSKDFSDLVTRTFTVGKLNQANKEALAAVKEAKDQYASLLDQQEQTKANLQADKTELETKQNDLKEMKAKSDQQQADLNKKIEDNRATLVALQTQYEEAANAVKLAQEKVNVTTTNAESKSENKTSEKASEKANTDSNNNGNSIAKQESVTTDTAISQGDGGSHPVVAGNTYPWGQCTWYVKQVAPWAGNNWGNGGQWGSSAAAAGFRVDHTPAAGAIVVFVPGQSVGGQWTADGAYGHVAYVESVNGGSITISQGGMGFSNPAGPNTQTVSNAGSYIYIHR